MANSVLREVESHYMQSIVDSVSLPIHQINTTENAPKKIYKVYNFSVLTVEQMFIRCMKHFFLSFVLYPRNARLQFIFSRYFYMGMCLKCCFIQFGFRFQEKILNNSLFYLFVTNTRSLVFQLQDNESRTVQITYILSLFFIRIISF